MSPRVQKGLLLAAAVWLGWSFVHGETRPAAKPQPVPESALMRAKVTSSHKVMEGLVSRDFIQIRDGAVDLIRICRATEWQAHADAVYSHHRNELIRQSQKLIEAADRSDLDATTFAYFNALKSCVDCHSHCRDVLRIANVHRRSKVIQIPTTDSDDLPPGERIDRR